MDWLDLSQTSNAHQLCLLRVDSSEMDRGLAVPADWCLSSPDWCGLKPGKMETGKGHQVTTPLHRGEHRLGSEQVWVRLPTLQQSVQGEIGVQTLLDEIFRKVRKRDRNRGHYFKNPSYRSKVTKILLIHLLIKITQQGLVTISAPNLFISWAVLSFWFS